MKFCALGKQRISEVIGYGEQLGVLRARSREEAEAFIYRKREELKTRLPEGDQSILDAFHEIEADERFLAKIRDIKERMMPVFRRLETLRMTLAKHEVPKTNLRTWAPGYARIDSFSDTLLWFVTDKRGSTEPISRQSIIDGLREAFSISDP
jgi:hypothetical protein